MPRFFIIALLLLGAIVMGLFYLEPEWERFNKLRNETEILRNVSAELDDLIANLGTLQEQISRISKDDRARIESALPRGPHAQDFLILLEYLAGKNHMQLKQVGITPAQAPQPQSGGQPRPGQSLAVEKPSAPFFTIPLALSLSGSYEDFKNIISDLEKSLRLIDIQDISFGGLNANVGTKQQSKEGTGFTVRAQTYYQ